MARRVVVFDTEEKPGVVVRKGGASKKREAAGNFAEAVKGADAPEKMAEQGMVGEASKKTRAKSAPKVEKTAQKGPKSAAPTAAKSEKEPQKAIAKPVKPQKKATKSFYEKAREQYLEKVDLAIANAAEFREDESREDRDYYALKHEFLSKLRDIVLQENAEDIGLAPEMEPFFWNEFKRVAEIIFSGPKQDTPQGKRVLPAWRKGGNKIALLLAKHMDYVRIPRDGYKLNTPPILLRDVVFYINGTMMHLERQMAENPDRANLGELMRLYRMVYKKSGMKHIARKFAQMIKKDNKYNIWKNKETLNYLLENELPEEEESE